MAFDLRGGDLRSEDRRKEEYGFWIDESLNSLLLHEGFVLDTSFVSCDTLNGNEALTLVQETAI